MYIKTNGCEKQKLNFQKEVGGPDQKGRGKKKLAAKKSKKNDQTHRKKRNQTLAPARKGKEDDGPNSDDRRESEPRRRPKGTNKKKMLRPRGNRSSEYSPRKITPKSPDCNDRDQRSKGTKTAEKGRSKGRGTRKKRSQGETYAEPLFGSQYMRVPDKLTSKKKKKRAPNHPSTPVIPRPSPKG